MSHKREAHRIQTDTKEAENRIALSEVITLPEEHNPLNLVLR